MKINFNQNLKMLDGSSIKRKEISGEKEKIISEETTLKYIVQEVLQLSFQDEKISGEDKAKRWLLATRIEANPENIDLTVEEISLIKQLIGKAYGPLIVGQSWQMLENVSPH